LPANTTYHINYYKPIAFERDIEESTPSSIKSFTPTKQKKHHQMSKENDPPKHLEDIRLDDTSNFINSNIQAGPTTSNNSQANAQQKNTEEYTNPTRLRLNLIHHRFARSTDQTTLQLFRSFMSIIKKADPKLIILPVDSTKQQFTSLTSHKQIETLTQQQLHLYFHSWFCKQHYSLSGFIHIVFSLDELVSHTEIAEWLETFQYAIKLCPSQDEEMSLIGALCYGSLFLYRKDLLLHIVQDPL